MQSVIKNSSLTNREEMLAQLQKAAQPDPQQQQMQQQAVQVEMATKMATVEKTKAETEQIILETKLKPSEVQAKVVAALSNNLSEDDEGGDFERRARIAELLLKEEDIASNERIATKQMQMKREASDKDNAYVKAAVDTLG